MWLSVSPQLRTGVGAASSGAWRLAFADNLLPRTHWNVEMSYYHDRSKRRRAPALVLLPLLGLVATWAAISKPF